MYVHIPVSTNLATVKNFILSSNKLQNIVDYLMELCGSVCWHLHTNYLSTTDIRDVQQRGDTLQVLYVCLLYWLSDGTLWFSVLIFTYKLSVHHGYQGCTTARGYSTSVVCVSVVLTIWWNSVAQCVNIYIQTICPPRILYNRRDTLQVLCVMVYSTCEIIECHSWPNLKLYHNLLFFWVF